MMNYQVIPVTPFEQNASLLWCPETMQGAVVDPGGDVDRILAAAGELGVQLQKIFVTHGHIDHAGGVADLRDRLAIEVAGPGREDEFWLQGMPQQSKMFGFPNVRSFVPDTWLADGDVVSVGKRSLEVIHCPGHTPGHVVFFDRSARLAFVGDVLFSGSIGRSDFPKGNHAQLVKSIREKLFPLGDDIEFVPGHGPNSTFGRERLTNPFVGD